MPNHRATEWLLTYGRRYPTAWTEYARMLANPPMQWPRWCFCPLAGAQMVIAREARDLRRAEAMDVQCLGALAAWRCTQGIYRIAPSLFSELWDTPVRGQLPIEVLERMPEWCVYIETPSRDSVKGFFAFLEHSASTGARELCLVLDVDDGERPRLVPARIHLFGTLEEGIRAAAEESHSQMAQLGLSASMAIPPQEQVSMLEGFVSLLLYLCAEDAEIDDRIARPTTVIAQKRKGPAMLAPNKPVIHETGVRIGGALFAARERYALSVWHSGASVAPHVRAAHWHAFWTGPRAGERKLTLRWLAPILVGFDDAPETATVRPVKDYDD